MRTLMFVMTFVFLSALRCFCADPVAAPTLAVAPVLATNYLLVTNMVVITNYIVTTNVVFNPDNVASTHTNDALPDLSWVPPEDNFDWIQLKSGEWLKAVQERKLEFYSEELDDLTFDWKDIRQVRAHRILDVLSVTGEKVSGPVTVTPDQILVGGAQPRVFSREQIQSLTRAAPKSWTTGRARCHSV